MSGELTVSAFHCLVCGGSSRELLERLSNSSCIFDMISNAISVVTRRRVRRLQLPPKPGDLDLLRGEFADLLPGLFALQHPRITELAPLGDLGRINALLTQIRSSRIRGDRDLVRGKVDEFLRRGERAPRPRPRPVARCAILWRSLSEVASREVVQFPWF